MTDVPHDTPQAELLELLDPWAVVYIDGERSLTTHTPQGILDRLTAAGYRVIRTDQLEHGDQLVQVGTREGDLSITRQFKAGVRPIRKWVRVVGNEQDTEARS